MPGAVNCGSLLTEPSNVDEVIVGKNHLMSSFRQEQQPNGQAEADICQSSGQAEQQNGHETADCLHHSDTDSFAASVAASTIKDSSHAQTNGVANGKISDEDDSSDDDVAADVAPTPASASTSNGVVARPQAPLVPPPPPMMLPGMLTICPPPPIAPNLFVVQGKLHSYAGFASADKRSRVGGAAERREVAEPRRVPSPVPTEARERALRLVGGGGGARSDGHAQLDGIGALLRQLRAPDGVVGVPIEFDAVPDRLTRPVHVDVSASRVGPASRSSAASSLSAASALSNSSAAQPLATEAATSTSGGLATGFTGSFQGVTASVPARFVPPEEALGPDDVPPPPPHPTDPEEIRRLMRSKMIRCKRCKNRFVERYVYERHLHDNHHDEYVVYMAEQELEMELQRKEELEQMRIEEIQSGGFIPPADDINAENFDDLDPTSIPLPGEETGGVVATFTRWGAIRYPRRVFKKKVSPQCAFCDKRFRNENSLRKHIAKKHPESVNFVQCNRCYKSLQSAELLEKHACELLWICFECVPMRNLCNEERLTTHRAKFHRGANSGFKCNECNRKFLTPRKLRKHKKMSHVVTRPFQCHFCDEFFPTETQVGLHERIHTGKIRFECNVCDYRANRFVRLDKHRREEHGYLCTICQDKISEWAELKDHTLREHGGYLTSERHARCIESPRVWIMYKGE